MSEREKKGAGGGTGRRLDGRGWRCVLRVLGGYPTVKAALAHLPVMAARWRRLAARFHAQAAQYARQWRERTGGQAVPEDPDAIGPRPDGSPWPDGDRQELRELCGAYRAWHGAERLARRQAGKAGRRLDWLKRLLAGHPPAVSGRRLDDAGDAA